MKKNNLIAFVAMICALVVPSQAPALGECGLACCIASAGSSGLGVADNFGLSIQYEDSDMSQLIHGTDKITADQVIADHWKMGSMYMVPVDHRMQKINFSGVWTATDSIQLLVVVPYVINDMTMQMKMPMGMIMKREMETVSGLGDISALINWNIYQDEEIRPNQRFSIGAGAKFATGQNNVDNADGSRVHAMLQPGTGSTDPVFTLHAMQAFRPLVLMVNLFYEVSREGKEGYEFGDQFTWDLLARYQLSSYLTVGAGLNGITTGQDKDHAGNFARPMMSMLDTPAYSGLHTTLASFSAQTKVPNTGLGLEVKYQLPIYQSVAGYQQVLKNRLVVNATWVF